MLLLPFLLLLLSPAAAGQGATPFTSPLSYVCDKPGSFEPNSTFEANVNSLVQTLIANATASGFAAGHVGAPPDRVFGLALCRGDTHGQSCHDYLSDTFQTAKQQCTYRKDVTIFHDQCMLRFSGEDFLAGVSNQPERVAWNMNNVRDADAEAFNRVVYGLMNSTAEYAARNASRYATGVAGFPEESLNVYGLVQCTPDLTTAQCRNCLAGIIAEMPKWLSGRIGGRILGGRCNLRYEKDLFFQGAGDVQINPLKPKDFFSVSRIT